ncbi:MAG: hypothetical protein H0X04_00230 [Chthoniobacterales bacterium]|nr:hypothetical protein [Chthoniobacterales bacterium]
MKLRVTIALEMEVDHECYGGEQPIIYESQMAADMGPSDYLEACMKSTSRQSRASVRIEEV